MITRLKGNPWLGAALLGLTLLGLALSIAAQLWFGVVFGVMLTLVILSLLAKDMPRIGTAVSKWTTMSAPRLIVLGLAIALPLGVWRYAVDGWIAVAIIGPLLLVPIACLVVVVRRQGW